MSDVAELAGNLRDVPLPELLKKIRDEKRSGALRISQPGEEIHLVFEKGEMRTVVSTAEGRSFGDALCRSGFVSREAVATALAELGAEGQAGLGTQLLRKGMITGSDLEVIALDHFGEIVVSALQWESGEFRFEDSAGDRDPDVSSPGSMSAVLMAAIRQIPKTEHFVELLGDVERFAWSVPTTVEQEEALRLDPAEAYLLSLCDGTISVRLILQLVPSRLAAARTLCALEIGGLIEFRDTLRPAAEPAAAHQTEAGPGEELPDPSWKGRLRDTWLPEILKTIFDERRTGTLKMNRPGEGIQLFFESGELRAAISTAEGRRLGETLRRRGVINDGELATALETLRSEGHGRLGRHLLQSGMISPAVLLAEVQSHFEEIVLSAFTWESGDFRFEDAAGRLDPDVTVPISLGAVLIVGTRQLPPREKFVELLGNLGRYASAVPATLERYEELRLQPSEAYLLSLCDGKSTLSAILKLAPSRQEAARTLYALEISGLVAFLETRRRESSPEVASERLETEVWSGSSPPDPEVRAQLARGNYLEARRLLEMKDYYGAIVLLEESVRLASDNSEYHFRLAGALARNASWRARAGHHYSQALLLDPVRQELMREYAEFLAAGGKFREAQAIARRLVQRYADEPRNRELLTHCDQSILEEEAASPQADGGDEEHRRRSIFSRIWGRRPT